MAGRPSKYESNVKPRFPEIAEWLQSGATEKEVADNLGINNKIFCKYKKEYKELNELVKNARRKPVQAIKAALFKRATGFVYSENKTVTEYAKYPDEIMKLFEEMGVDLSGMEKPKVIRHEAYEKYALPDPASAMILLKHWDKETEWTQDPASLKLKKEEFEFKKEHAESGDW